MRVAVLGTGAVGQTIGTALAERGHAVTLGTRTPGKPEAVAWSTRTGGAVGTFAEAADGADLVVLAISGSGATDALGAALAAIPEDGPGPVVLDITNPLDFSRGFPPTLSVANDDSLAERLQTAYPRVRIVKALNTLTAALMVAPGSLPERTHVFVCGNDDAAKRIVRGVLGEFGWADEDVIDLGDLTNARGTEAYLLLWIRLYGALGTADFNIRIVRGPAQ